MAKKTAPAAGTAPAAPAAPKRQPYTKGSSVDARMARAFERLDEKGDIASRKGGSMIGR